MKYEGTPILRLSAIAQTAILGKGVADRAGITSTAPMIVGSGLKGKFYQRRIAQAYQTSAAACRNGSLARRYPLRALSRRFPAAAGN